MEHYVTLFDRLFLPQGLALQQSMQRHCDNFTLWILCVDDQVFDDLCKLQLDNVRLLQLSKLETPELLTAKPTRTKVEYYWTLTPCTARFVFEADSSVERVTYIDADMWFRKRPTPIFREFEESGKDVLITDHAYAPAHDQSATCGQFCVQFLTFRRIGGETVRKWWEARCLEWCHNREEDGKFGDQKYLDQWPELFEDNIHILKDVERLLAPWNATRFPYGNSVAWHFHDLRIRVHSASNIYVEYGTYRIPKTTRENIYEPYLLDLRTAIERIQLAKIPLSSQKSLSLIGKIIPRLKVLKKVFFLFDTTPGKQL